MKVAFSPRARRDLDKILNDLLTLASHRTAVRVFDRIERRCLSLDVFPDRGTMYAHPYLRHLRRLIEPPYVIVYEVMATKVEIFTILHGSQNIQAELLKAKAD